MIVQQMVSTIEDFVVNLSLNVGICVDAAAVDRLIAGFGRRFAAFDRQTQHAVIEALRISADRSDDEVAGIVRALMAKFQQAASGPAAARGGPEDVALHAARIIAELIVFEDGSDEDEVDPDLMCKIMEGLAADLEGMNHADLRRLVDAFPVVADELGGDEGNLVRNIPYHFYLEEALAGDDPVRLAQLEAERDARDD